MAVHEATFPTELDRFEDFDLRLDLHHLVERPGAPGRSVWTTSRVPNVLCGGGALALGAAFALTVRFGGFLAGAETSPGERILDQLLQLMVAVAFVALLVGALQHGKLVVDRDRRELRVYRGLRGRLRHTLPLDGIRRLDHVAVVGESFGTHDGGTDWDRQHDVLAAETEDGRLVMIAVDTPRSLRGAIAEAAGLPQTT